jgi:hypothetical protein
MTPKALSPTAVIGIQLLLSNFSDLLSTVHLVGHTVMVGSVEAVLTHTYNSSPLILAI